MPASTAAEAVAPFETALARAALLLAVRRLATTADPTPPPLLVLAFDRRALTERGGGAAEEVRDAAAAFFADVTFTGEVLRDAEGVFSPTRSVGEPRREEGREDTGWRPRGHSCCCRCWC